MSLLIVGDTPLLQLVARAFTNRKAPRLRGFSVKAAFSHGLLPVASMWFEGRHEVGEVVAPSRRCGIEVVLHKVRKDGYPVVGADLRFQVVGILGRDAVGRVVTRPRINKLVVVRVGTGNVLHGDWILAGDAIDDAVSAGRQIGQALLVGELRTHQASQEECLLIDRYCIHGHQNPPVFTKPGGYAAP